MRLRIFITLAISVVLGGATLWAQGRGRQASGGGRTNPGAQSPSRNVPATNSFRGHRAYHAQPYGYRFGRRTQFGMGFHFPGYDYGSGYGRYYGFSPYSYQPYYDTRFYSYPYYGCDTRFSSWPYNCQPLYPSGPQASRPGGMTPYDQGEEYEPGSSDSAASGPATAPAPPAPISAEDTRRPDPRDVVLTLDGSPRLAGGTAQPVVLGSGRHTLSISATPAASLAPPANEAPPKK